MPSRMFWNGTVIKGSVSPFTLIARLAVRITLLNKMILENSVKEEVIVIGNIASAYEFGW